MTLIYMLQIISMSLLNGTSPANNTVKEHDPTNSTVSTLFVDWLQQNVTNSSDWNTTTDETMSSVEEKNLRKLHEFQIIKAVVLATVTVIIMISVCKMVFQLFVRYAGKQDDR